MRYRTFGATGEQVSVIGLGCGGPSRLGLRDGGSQEGAIETVRAAIDLGINIFDTAEAYGNEEVLGGAIPAALRDKVLICTKVGAHTHEGAPCPPQQFRERVHACLRRLRTNYVDVLYVHGVSPADYDYVVAEICPVLDDLRKEGAIRYRAISEAFGQDTGHAMLSRAVRDSVWDVMMVGFNLLNQSARERVIQPAAQKGIGVVMMFAVRRALRDAASLRAAEQELGSRGLLADGYPSSEPLDAFLSRHGLTDIPDVAYRFCAAEPGVHTVLSGTGNPAHLRSNAQSLCGEPLPPEVMERLRQEFAGVDSYSGNG